MLVCVRRGIETESEEEGERDHYTTVNHFTSVLAIVSPFADGTES